MGELRIFKAKVMALARLFLGCSPIAEELVSLAGSVFDFGL